MTGLGNTACALFGPRCSLAFVALLLTACGGTDSSPSAGRAGAAQGGTRALPTAGEPGAGGGTHDAAGTPAAAGATLAEGGGFGGSALSARGGSEAGSGQESGGTGGASGASSAGGSASGAAGAGGSMVDPCEPKTWEQACAGRTCGKAFDGCGEEYGCGSCTGLTECVEGTCQTTCAVLEYECGTYPGLSCGECDEGQDCGVVGTAKCSTCEHAKDFDYICSAATTRPRLLKPCSEERAEAQDCRRPFNQDPTWWCCP